jgi:hypothetical protein
VHPEAVPEAARRCIETAPAATVPFGLLQTAEKARMTTFANQSANLTDNQAQKLHDALDIVKRVISDLVDRGNPGDRGHAFALHEAAGYIVDAARDE